MDFEALSLGISVGPVGNVVGRDLAIAALLGVLAALFGILIMRGVALCETGLAKTRLWPPLRPALGGLGVGLLALLTPQVMSSGMARCIFPASSRCRCRSSPACSS